MKKIFIMLTVATLGCTNAFAQLWDYSKPDKRWTFGVRAGLNRTHAFYDDYSYCCGTSYNDYFSDRTNFQGGIVADYNIVKSFSVETGLSFSYKQIKEKEDKTIHTFPYIELSLLAMYRYYLSENIHLQLKAGPYLGYNNNYTDDNSISGFSDIKKMDGGISTGVGLSHGKWFIGANYEWGQVHVTGSRETRLHTLNISVGYDF